MKMEFYTLEIDGTEVFLDGQKIKGLSGYVLERSENGIPLLTLKVYIEPTKLLVKP
jgi:hypothetical protein